MSSTSTGAGLRTGNRFAGDVSVRAYAPALIFWVVAAAGALGAATAVAPVLGIGLVAIALGMVALRAGAARWALQRWDELFLHILVLSIFLESVTVAGVTIGRLLSVVCAVALFVRIVVQGRQISMTAAVRCLPALALVTFYVISGLWSANTPAWLFSLGQMALALSYFSAVIVLAPENDPARIIRPLLRTFAIGALFAGLYGSFQLLYLNRAVGLQGDPNIYAAYQVAAIPAALGLLAKSRARWLWALCLLVATVSVIASDSRGAIIALLVTLPLSAILLAAGRHRPWWIGVGVLSTAAIVAIALQANTRADKWAADRGSGRIDIWYVAWQAFLENPWFGIGSGQFLTESVKLLLTTPGVELLRSHLLSGTGIQVHNLYLEALVERGVLGLILLLVLLLSGAYYLLRARDPKRPEVAALAPMLVAFSVGTFFLSVPNNKLLWILLGLSVILVRTTTVDRPESRGRSQ